MDQNRFDSVARSIGAPATRRNGIKALVGGLIGLGGAVAITSAEAKKKNKGPRCGDGRCGAGQACFENQCICKNNGSLACNGQCCGDNEVCLSGLDKPCQRVQGWDDSTCGAYDATCGVGCGRYATCADDSKCCSNNCTNAGDTGFPYYTVMWRCRE